MGARDRGHQRSQCWKYSKPQAVGNIRPVGKEGELSGKGDIHPRREEIHRQIVADKEYADHQSAPMV